MKAPANCRLIGRWRIVEADIWDRAYLNLCGPATLTITAQGGEIAFGALEAGLEVEYARTRSASAGPDPTKTTKSRVKELPNSSKTAPSKSSSPMKTATKPPSRRNETLLQHPARLGSRHAVPAVANGRQQTELLPYPMPEERSQRRRKDLRPWKLRGGRLEARKSETGSKPGGKDDLQTLPLKGLSR